MAVERAWQRLEKKKVPELKSKVGVLMVIAIATGQATQKNLKMSGL